MKKLNYKLLSFGFYIIFYKNRYYENMSYLFSNCNIFFLSQSNFSAFINPCGSLVVNLKCNFSGTHVFLQEFSESPKISQCLTHIQHLTNQVLMMTAFCELSCKAIWNFYSSQICFLKLWLHM